MRSSRRCTPGSAKLYLQHSLYLSAALYVSSALRPVVVQAYFAKRSVKNDGGNSFGKYPRVNNVSRIVTVFDRSETDYYIDITPERFTVQLFQRSASGRAGLGDVINLRPDAGCAFNARPLEAGQRADAGREIFRAIARGRAAACGTGLLKTPARRSRSPGSASPMSQQITQRPSSGTASTVTVWLQFQQRWSTIASGLTRLRFADREVYSSRLARIAKPVDAPAGRRNTRGDRLKNAFLAAFVVCASIKTAAKATRISRTRHYEWMRKDPSYPARFRQAYIEARDALEDKAVELALIGEFVPNIFQGRFVYPEEEVVIPATDTQPERVEMRPIPGAPPLGIRKKSDALLMFLLRVRMPEKYGRVRQVATPEFARQLADRRLARLTNADFAARLTGEELATLKLLTEKLGHAGESPDAARE